jgi:aryl-alcohol dehydrogenase-like predicted oxidoreductase
VEELAKEKRTGVAQIAIAYLLNQNFLVFPIISSVNTERMKENLEALKITLTEKDLEWLNLERDSRR